MTNNLSRIISSAFFLAILFVFNFFNVVAQTNNETKKYVRIFPKFQTLSSDTVDYEWIVEQDRIVIEKEEINRKKLEFFKKNSIAYEENLNNTKRLDIKNYRIVSSTLSGKCIGERTEAYSYSDSLSEDQLDYLKNSKNGNHVFFEVKIEQLDTHRIYETSMKFFIRRREK